MQRRLIELRRRLLTKAGLPPWLERWTIPLRYLWLLYRRMETDRAFLRAAGMAYATLMALVPLLLLLFGALEATGMLQRNPEAVEALIFGSFLGDIPEVRSFLLPGLLQVDLATLGLVGIGGLAVVAGRLYIQVEAAYCRIFGVEVERPFYRRLLLFYVAVTLAPVLVTAMFLQGWEWSAVLGMSGASTVTVSLVQLAVLMAAMFGFPNTRVAWWPAVGGCFTSLVLLQLVSWAFRAYLVIFAADDPVRVIYGSVGVLPVFLLWLYLAWLTVLIGVEVAAVAQNYRSLFDAEYAEVVQDHMPGILPGVDTVLLVAAVLARWYGEGRGIMSLEDLVRDTGLRGVELNPVLRALEVGGIAVQAEPGWLLARPAEQIPLHEIIDLWRARTSPHAVTDPHVAAIRAEIDQHESGSLADAAARWRPKVGPVEVAP